MVCLPFLFEDEADIQVFSLFRVLIVSISVSSYILCFLLLSALYAIVIPLNPILSGSSTRISSSVHIQIPCIPIPQLSVSHKPTIAFSRNLNSHFICHQTSNPPLITPCLHLLITIISPETLNLHPNTQYSSLKLIK